MRKKLAKWLLLAAKKLEPSEVFSLADKYEPKKLGIGFHISKKDIKEYRMRNPNMKSNREALSYMIKDTKKEIGISILAGAYKNGLIRYKVRSTLWSADVVGELYVYEKSEESN